jgi:quaternary ammonium compound-resistance protein SugE
MAWLYLIAAGLLEIGWPIGMRLSGQPATRVLGIAMAISLLALSGLLLWRAQLEIPMGTSYAVWTGIGATGTFLVGVCCFGEPLSFGRAIGALLIITGVVTLRLTH